MVVFGRYMGRRTKTQEINRYKFKQVEEAKYYVSILFKETPSPRYYKNLRELEELEPTTTKVHKTYEYENTQKAHTHVHLARHYGAEALLIREINGEFSEITKDEYTRAKGK